MPHKSGSKWKWGNIERDSEDELRKTVWGIWKKNGGKGSFSKFWETGKVSEEEEIGEDFLGKVRKIVDPEGDSDV